jgi:phosphoribosylformylglycinamidine cyclo-ligase
VNEAHRVFNMGIGMVLLVDTEEVGKVRAHLESIGETVLEIGYTEAASHESGKGRVRWI